MKLFAIWPELPLLAEAGVAFDFVWPPVAIALAYLIGSIPFGFLIARGLKGIDIRQHGSGNIGATNVGRVLGAKWGILALVLDLVKALLPACLCALPLSADSPWKPHLPVACGVAAILGHMYPCYLALRGGKGVASALGVIAYLSPWSTIVSFGTFVVSFAVWRIVSLSSILASLAFAAAHFWIFQNDLWTTGGWSLTTFALAIPSLIIVRHRTNIGRLLKGQEPRFTTRKQA